MFGGEDVDFLVSSVLDLHIYKNMGSVDRVFYSAICVLITMGW